MKKMIVIPIWPIFLIIIWAPFVSYLGYRFLRWLVVWDKEEAEPKKMIPRKYLLAWFLISIVVSILVAIVFS